MTVRPPRGSGFIAYAPLRDEGERSRVPVCSGSERAASWSVRAAYPDSWVGEDACLPRRLKIPPRRSGRASLIHSGRQAPAASTTVSNIAGNISGHPECSGQVKTQGLENVEKASGGEVTPGQTGAHCRAFGRVDEPATLSPSVMLPAKIATPGSRLVDRVLGAATVGGPERPVGKCTRDQWGR